MSTRSQLQLISYDKDKHHRKAPTISFKYAKSRFWQRHSIQENGLGAYTAQMVQGLLATIHTVAVRWGGEAFSSLVQRRS